MISVDIDEVQFPNGSVGELEIVRHPGAAAVIPFLTNPSGEDPQILLIRQYRYAASQYLFEVPAGKLDPGESPTDCARRELLEETGCTAESVEHLITIFTTPGFTNEKIHLYMAHGLTRGETHHENDEFIELQAKPLSEVLKMIERGEIIDGKSLVAILYAAGYCLGR